MWFHRFSLGFILVWVLMSVMLISQSISRYVNDQQNMAGLDTMITKKWTAFQVNPPVDVRQLKFSDASPFNSLSAGDVDSSVRPGDCDSNTSPPTGTSSDASSPTSSSSSSSSSSCEEAWDLAVLEWNTGLFSSCGDRINAYYRNAGMRSRREACWEVAVNNRGRFAQGYEQTCKGCMPSSTSDINNVRSTSNGRSTSSSPAGSSPAGSHDSPGGSQTHATDLRRVEASFLEDHYSVKSTNHVNTDNPSCEFAEGEP